MTREVKNGKVAFKGGQWTTMSGKLFLFPGTNNTDREKVYLVASMVQRGFNNIYRHDL